jgi:uncharacterized protein YkwD
MSIHKNKYPISIILTISLILIITPVVAFDTSGFYGQFVDRATSDDGALTIKSSENNTIFLFENGNNVSTWSYNIHGNIWSAAISPDGQYIAIGSEGGLIWLFEQKGSVAWNKSFGNGAIRSIEFSPDSQYLDASNFMNQAFFISVDGNPATRTTTRTTTEIPSGTPVVIPAPMNPDFSSIVSFILGNTNIVIGIIAVLCMACIIWYGISQRKKRRSGSSASVPDIITLKNFTIFSLVLMLVSFLPDYYPLAEYAGFFRTAFGIGLFCFIVAYFLYAVKIWGADSRLGAVFMVAVPIFAYTLATSKIPGSTSNIFVYLGIQFCLFALFSAIVLFASDVVKKGLDGMISGNRHSRYFRPETTYAFVGLVAVSIVAVNAGSVAMFSDNLNSMTGSIQKTSSHFLPNSESSNLKPATTYNNFQTIPTTESNFINEIQKAVSHPEPTLDIPSLERRIHELINQQRTTHGLSALRFDTSLTAVARKHSEDMARNNYFSHVNLQGLDPTGRGTQAGYSCYKNYGSYYTTGLAENIFQTHHSTTYNGITVNDMESSESIAQSTVNGWMNSPGHQQNILTSTYDREGIGVGISSDKTVYVTEDFC